MFYCMVAGKCMIFVLSNDENNNNNNTSNRKMAKIPFVMLLPRVDFLLDDRQSKNTRVDSWWAVFSVVIFVRLLLLFE